MSVTLYLLRHGQTEFSREDTFCGSGLDPELTADGLKMAHAFADAYKKTPWRGIYCSSLRRGITTAQPLCDAVGMEPHIRSEINEIAYGQWEGKTKTQVSEEYHDDYIRWVADPAWHAPTGGETAVTIASRGMKVIEEIKAECSDGNVLLVSHKATVRIIICALLGIDVGRFRYRLVCPVGSVSVIEFSAEGPLLRALADISHFTEELRSLPGT
jgi:broad specificity phosphatase PhoE